MVLPNTLPKNNDRLRACLVMNGIVLVTILAMLIQTHTVGSKYLRFGPNDDLEVVGAKIDTWTKYVILQVFLAFLQVSDAIINEFASPILGFNVYNPDKKIITEFSRFELQLYANTMWFINGIKGVLMVVVTVSQIDIAVLKVIYSELTCIYTVGILLGEKTFEPMKYDQVPTNETGIEMA